MLDESRRLGSGGEGHIYVVPTERGLAAKVYDQPSADRAAKLAAMLANPPDDPTKSAGHTSIAWPMDLLLGTGGVVGYLMPCVRDMRELFEFYNPGLPALFLRCFEDGHDSPGARPEAREWRRALEEAVGAMAQCSSNGQHYYGPHLRSCPWCARTRQMAGRDPFPSVQAVRQGVHLQAPPPPRAATPRPAVTAPPPPYQPPVATRTKRRGFAVAAAFAALAAAVAMGVAGCTQHAPSPVAATAPASAPAAAATAPASAPAAATPAAFAPSTQTKINPKDGAEMIKIPAGPFQMGDSDRGDNPVHSVTLSSYYIYQNDVTVAMYEKFCAATGHAMPDSPPWGWDNGNYPVVNVTWDDAKAYCDWAGVHLPTEAQWEKAARGTDGRQYPWGNDWDSAKCANSVSPDNLSSPKPVGSYPSGASPYKVMDMAGNVWNWRSDWYDPDYCKGDHGADPTGPDSGDARVLRGGSWNDGGTDGFRASDRYGNGPTSGGNELGLRGASGP